MKNYDLIVLGGGISGVAAAVCAARGGLSVLLIEKGGCLGGAMSNNLVFPFMSHATKGEPKKIFSKGIFEEMKERFAAYGESSWEYYKFVFDDMVSEAGVDVLFHATVFDAAYQERRIQALSVAAKGGVLKLSADSFIDASGDGDLIALAGCALQLGRESDGLCQPMTNCFRLSNVDTELMKEERPRLQELYKEQQAAGKIKNPRENILMMFGLGENILHLNTTRVIRHNPVDPFEISRAEMLARKQVAEMVRFLKENAASCKDAELIYVANEIGVRESRKLKGVHILTADEMKNFADYEDTIALGNYMIDIHNPCGSGTTLYRFEDGTFYRIPYRCLLPKEYDNLLVAGRCLSADHEAHSAVRIMPICACLGQAAGMAMALAKENGTNLHTLDVKELQRQLIKAGAVIE